MQRDLAKKKKKIDELILSGDLFQSEQARESANEKSM